MGILKCCQMVSYWTFCDNSTSVGHFTQLVWKDTYLEGCALSVGATKVYVVCRYDPTGKDFN